jgi:hypothetical protein
MLALAGYFPHLADPIPKALGTPVVHREPKPIRHHNADWHGPTRQTPMPRAGDILGDWRVVDVLGRGFGGRSELRLSLVCTTCGRTRETNEFNARKVRTCGHGTRTLAAGKL